MATQGGRHIPQKGLCLAPLSASRHEGCASGWRGEGLAFSGDLVRGHLTLGSGTLPQVHNVNTGSYVNCRLLAQ